MVVSFCAVLFPTRCLDEILNLIESVSEGFFLLTLVHYLQLWYKTYMDISLDQGLKKHHRFVKDIEDSNMSANVRDFHCLWVFHS